MKFLLDTHCFLWAISNSSLLPKKVINYLENQENEIFLSSASVWEIFIKFKLGKLDLKKDPENLILEEMQIGNYKSLEIKMNHIFPMSKLSQYHKDPFDRILICQAISEGLTILTNDPLIKKYKVKTVW